jgi:phage-related protein
VPDNFGLKIGVEGEKEFKKALSDINQSFKVLGSEMTLITSQFDKNEKSIQSLTSRNEVLNKEIDAQRGKIDTLRAALANAAESFGENDRRTQNWKIQLNKAEAELNNMEREVADNTKAIDKMGTEETETAKQTDNLAEEVDKSGKSADDAGGKFDKLGGILKGVSVAMAAVFAAVGAAAITATKTLTDYAVGTAAYADEMLTLSTVTGVSAENLQAYSYAADLVDVSLETMTGSMAKNVKSMSSAKDGSKTAQVAYAALGVAVTDSNGALRDGETVYWEAIDALGQISNETERDALAMQIFGKSARDLNPLIAQGSAGIAELTEEAKTMGAVLSDKQLLQAGAFDDTIQRLTQGSQAAKNALGMVLLPTLDALGTQGAELLGNFTRGLNEAGGDLTKVSAVIGEAVGGIADMILEQLPLIIDTAMGIVAAIGGAIMDNLGVIVDAAVQIVLTLLDGLIAALPALTQGAIQLVLTLVKGILANLPALVGAAMQMISALVEGIGEALPELIPAAVEAIMLVAQTLIENLPALLKAALKLITGFAKGLIDSIPVIIKRLPEIIKAIVDYFIGAIPLIIDTGIKLLVSLVQALPTIITAIVAAIPQIIDSIITAVIESIPLIVDAGVELLISLIQNLPEIITTVVAAIPLIVSALVDAIIGNIDKIVLAGFQLFVALIQNLPMIKLEILKAIPQIIEGIVSAIASLHWKMVEAGSNLIKGLWQGINNVKSWIWSKIRGFFSDIVDDIKSYFGIRSPSTLFAELGENMAAGLGLGFGEEMAKVSRDMQNAIPHSFDSDFNVNGTASGSYPAGTTQYITINSPKALSEKETAREFKNLSRRLALGVI